MWTILKNTYEDCILMLLVALPIVPVDTENLYDFFDTEHL